MGNNIHIFDVSFDEKTKWVIESLNIAQKAAQSLLNASINAEWTLFNDIIETLDSFIVKIYESSKQYKDVYNDFTLCRRCQALIGSLHCIKKYLDINPEKTLSKIEFELIPILEEAYMDFYYQAYVLTYPEREKKYFEEEMYKLASNKYINQSIKTGNFKYEVSICVLAYNKIEYTQKCLHSILENIPDDLNYELILWDNGSTDGTAQFFESLNPTKLIQSRVNWGAEDINFRVAEGRYLITVANDVIVAPNTIENLVKTMRSDDRIGKAVPSTSNVSNCQVTVCDYESIDGLYEFARKNNIYDPFRHEERTRLVDPIAIWDSIKSFSEIGICHGGYLCSLIAFPDDFVSFLMRRRKYKMVLCKDAYCHHFGSVTIDDDFTKINKQKYYNEVRNKLKSIFGVDPWGIGVCYNPIFFERVVGEEFGHKEVLGINCGMGSNSLKIKDQIKEYCHNTDCVLTNVTDDKSFILDLAGVSDKAEVIYSISGLKKYLDGIKFDYIVIEDRFLKKCSFIAVIQILLDHLTDNGTMFMKKYPEYESWINNNKSKITKMDEEWLSYKR